MREIKKIYLAKFLVGCSAVASVTYTLYFLSHGLSQTQIGQLFALFMISLAILDIPTGGLSDMYGHKTSVAVGLFFHSLGSLSFFLFPYWSGFQVGMILSALGLALESGAWSSLIYEILQKNKQEKTFQKVLGRGSAFMLAGAIIFAPIGTILYKIAPSLPYFLAAFFIFLACIVILFVKWDFRRKMVNFRSYWKNTAKGVYLTLRNKNLVYLGLIGLVMSMSRLVVNQNISQPFQVSIGIDIAYIGITAAIVAGLGALVSASAHKITDLIGKKLSLIMLVLLPSLSLFVMSYFFATWTVLLLFVFYSAQAFRDPLIGSLSQKEMSSDVMATMGSTISFMVSILVGLLLPLWGKGIDLFGLKQTMFYLAASVAVVGSLGVNLYFRSVRNTAA